VRSPAFLAAGRPPAAAEAVSRASGAHGIVLADDRHADWLLWLRPELAGRVAYDVRFELFSAPELQRIKVLEDSSRAARRRCGAGVSVVVWEISGRGRRGRDWRPRPASPLRGPFSGATIVTPPRAERKCLAKPE